MLFFLIIFNNYDNCHHLFFFDTIFLRRSTILFHGKTKFLVSSF